MSYLLKIKKKNKRNNRRNLKNQKNIKAASIQDYSSICKIVRDSSSLPVSVQSYQELYILAQPSFSPIS